MGIFSGCLKIYIFPEVPYLSSMKTFFIGLLVSGPLPPLLMRKLVTAKLSCEADCTDFLTIAGCSGLGLVVLDRWKGLEVWHAIPWMYLPA